MSKLVASKGDPARMFLAAGKKIKIHGSGHQDELTGRFLLVEHLHDTKNETPVTTINN